ncbi:hypothetical protein EL17_24030 [Anditalea andensis]|uniref:Uncharacterized protein n=1 Tax=Anditalea andensis TaxID=1048983 RepID=A0A074KVM7_9BACT|nr:hypothetical protein EL17_24030 [Anditalea andensis]
MFDGRIKQSAKQVGDRAKDYRQVQKENAIYIKQRKRDYHTIKDSLGHADSLKLRIPSDSIKQLIKAQEEHYVYTDTLYMLQQISGWDKSEMLAKNQSISMKREKLEGKEYLSKYANLKREIGSHRKTLKVYRDSLSAIDSLDRDEINYRVKQRKQELSVEYEKKLESISREIVNEKTPGLPGGFQNKELEKFQKAHSNLKANFGNDGMANLSKAQGVDHFAGKHNVLQAAQEEVAVLKKKYAEVVDSNDLSTATKVNSLKGEPLMNRLVFGGTFQLHVDRNTNLDLNPEIGYRMNRNFDMGMGGTYRIRVATKDLPQWIKEPNVMGFRGFANHLLFKNLFLHGEYEGLKSSMRPDAGQAVQEWHGSLLTGIQKRFRLKGKAQGQVLLLYNFHYRENPLYNSPWVMRVGVGN